MLDGPEWEETSGGMIETCMRARSDSGRKRWNETHVVSIIVRIVVVIVTLTLVAIISILLFVHDPSNILGNVDQVSHASFIFTSIKYLAAERNG